MKRRKFIQAGALGTGAIAALGMGACAVGENPVRRRGNDVPAPVAALNSRADSAPPPIDEAERAERRERAQRLMAEAGIDALFIEPGASLTYFAGVRWGRSERTFGLLLPRQGEGIIICPAFEEGRAERGIDGRFEIRTWEEDESPFALIGQTLRDLGIATGTIGLEESTRHFIAAGIARDVPALRVVSADPVTHRCRGVKTSNEVELMRFANRITVKAIEATFASLREGMTQADIAATTRSAFDRLGFGSGVWVLALIGESSAYPHGSENPAPLREGDAVLIDTGTQVHGYQSDISRTTVLGEPSAEFKEVYGIVHEAQARALEVTAPGRTAGEIDAAARDVVDRAGYGPDYRHFTHRLGHGIGLEGHEWPYLVRGSDVILEPGMSFSNEPGIYQYGKFGVRLEDIMVVTRDGAELLTEPAAPVT